MQQLSQVFRKLIPASLGFAVAFSAAQLMATVVLPNLPAGTKYELIFVTLDSTTALSSDITTYNTFASTEASLSPTLAAIGVQWHAVASTATVDAIVNAPDNGIAVYNTQGIEVATAATGIYNGGLLSPVQYNQFGNSDTAFVWTGANTSGGVVPNGQMGNDNDVEQGLSNFQDSNWIANRNVVVSSNGFPLYALSPPITVPVPEPSSLALLGIGTLGAIGLGLRSRCRKLLQRRQ
jgi:hypothetical protein